MANFLAEPISLFPVKPQRSISISENSDVIFEFKGYLTISEDAGDEIEITRHPVQQGAQITDHAFKKPSSVKISILANDNEAPLSEVYSDLIAVQEKRTPMKVITGKRSYSNMLLKSIQQTTGKQTENVLALSLGFEEIIIVEVSPTTVPPRRKQRNAGATGATEKAGRKSALATAKDGLASFFGGL